MVFVRMMYEQQQHARIDVRKRMERKGSIKEERLEIVDLSGMSLEALPISPSLNLGTICNLDLSNNNIQVFFTNNILVIFLYQHLSLSLNQNISNPDI